MSVVPTMPAPSPYHKEQSRQDFSRRLAEALQKSGRDTSPTTLAMEFNARFAGTPVHMASCRKWLLGEAIPTQEKLVVLAQMLGVTADWLRFGDSTQTMAQEMPKSYEKEEWVLVSDIARLMPRDRILVEKLISGMLQTP